MVFFQEVDVFVLAVYFDIYVSVQIISIAVALGFDGDFSGCYVCQYTVDFVFRIVDSDFCNDIFAVCGQCYIEICIIIVFFQIAERIICQFVFDIYIAVHIVVIRFAVGFDCQFVIIQICQQTGFRVVVLGNGIQFCDFVVSVEIDGNGEVVAVVQCAEDAGRCCGFVIQIYLHIVGHGICFFFGTVFDSDLVGAHIHQFKGLFGANAVDRFCNSDGFDAVTTISQCDAVTAADFGEIDFLAVIICFCGAFFTKEVQTSACSSLYAAEQVAVFQYGSGHNGTGYRAAGRCFRFCGGAASCAAAGEQFICLYGKNCHFGTVDVYFGIEVVVIITYHDVFVIEQIQIGHRSFGDGASVFESQFCIHIYCVNFPQSLAEDNAYIFSVCRLLCRAIHEFCQVACNQDAFVQGVCHSVICPRGDFVRIHNGFPFGDGIVCDVLFVVCFHDGVHELCRFAVSHVVAGFAVFFAVFGVAAHKPQRSCFFDECSGTGPRYIVNIRKSGTESNCICAAQYKGGSGCQCKETFHI